MHKVQRVFSHKQNSHVQNVKYTVKSIKQMIHQIT